MHKAAQNKRRSICCMLVAGGAALMVKDRLGRTPRDLALIAEDCDLAAYLYSKCKNYFFRSCQIEPEFFTSLKRRLIIFHTA